MTHRRGLTVLFGLGLIAARLVAAAPAVAADFPLPLENRLSGISLSLSGVNGVDWVVENSFHDTSVGEQTVYLKSSVQMSLAHNANNVITLDCALPHVQGAAGGGDIYYKIDRDLQAHPYSTKGGAALPSYCVKYATPFAFDTLTYDGTLPVLGAVGDNGGAWGAQPMNTTARFAYGQSDTFGRQWHTLTYWDDDEPLLAAAGIDSHRQGASDGHCVFLCVNPQTPVIQLFAPVGQQFYTTPVKTCYRPKIWTQTSYVTAGVKVHLVNLANAEPIQYRVAGGPWQTYGGAPLVASDLFPAAAVETLLETRCGATGPIYSRTFVRDPGVPAPDETHGFLLWADEAERQAIITKVHTIQPFKTSYTTFRGSYYQGTTTTFTDARGSWCSGAGVASTALSNALVVALEGPTAALAEARAAKTRLLRLARLQPVGFDYNVSSATPAKDFLNELGQTIQQFADAGVAYDLVAAHFRSSQHPEGLTPIEEIMIRDGLAKIAKSILQARGNWSATSGSGDTHWAHGYELAVGLIAMAMPTYKTPYYGASGADGRTRNDTPEADGTFWNPYPDQGVTWYQCATDSAIATPGHPGVRYPFRAEFLTTDDGWWTGANDLVGDGDRYFTGPMGSRLVDVKYGNMGNAECRTELVEMSGYESPFVDRLTVFDHARRLRGDTTRPPCVTNYIRRRLVAGYVPLSWNATTKVYTAGAPRIQSSVWAFNNRYEAASLPSARALMGTFLNNLNIYYGYVSGSLDAATRAALEQDRKVFYNAYALALCLDPSQLAAHPAEPNYPPIVKPQFKHVVRPGETVQKDVIAMDPNDDALTITVSDLPAGATFDPATRRLTWVPTAADAGVHVATVTASDGVLSTSVPFVMNVKADAPAGPIPAAPTNVRATLSADERSVALSWTAPSGVTVARYVIYRDGVLWAVVPAAQTSYVDNTVLRGTSTRYHVACYNTAGSESSAPEATGSYIRTTPGPRVSAWTSSAEHGAAGTVAAALAPGGVESRLTGLQCVRLTVDTPLLASTVNAAAVTVRDAAGADLSGRVDSVALDADGRTVIVTFAPPLAAAGRYTVALTDRVLSDRYQMIQGASATFGVLPGDVNGSGQVTAADVVAVREAAGCAVSAANARLDVNASGDITGDDVQAVQRRLGTSLP